MTQIFVLLYRIDNRIQHVLPHLEFRLEKRDEIFAIVGVHPHTVLQSDEADLAHDRAQTRPDTALPFRHVENDHSPAPIPFLFLIFECYLRLFKRERFASRGSQAQIFLAVFSLDPFCIPFRDQATRGRLRTIAQVVFLVWQIIQKLDRVPGDRRERDESGYGDCSEYRVLDISPPFPLPRRLFQLSHSLLS